MLFYTKSDCNKNTKIKYNINDNKDLDITYKKKKVK